jgi:nucleotide-binding universal stress UspA family protein
VVQAANELSADLIVVGSRGHGRLEESLLGSVSDAVARHARCSVLIVR